MERGRDSRGFGPTHQDENTRRKGFTVKRFAAAAVLLTMGLFQAGCENKPAAPKTVTPAVNPADMMKNMPKPAGTEEKKPEGEAGATEEKKEPAEPATTEEAKAPEGDAPAATEEKKDGEEKKDE